jgi:hypothetical protein
MRITRVIRQNRRHHFSAGKAVSPGALPVAIYFHGCEGRWTAHEKVVVLTGSWLLKWRSGPNEDACSALDDRDPK